MQEIQLNNNNSFNFDSNKNLVDISNNQNQYSFNKSQSSFPNYVHPTLQQTQSHSNIDINSLTTIFLAEELLPVIYENKSNENQITNLSSPKRNSDQSHLNTNRLFGYFQVCYINERKLTFKKREFTDVI